MNENELNELVIVKQLPVITQQLQIISDEVDKRIEHAMSLECTEESLKEVKNERADLNKIKTALEDRRKQVKEAVLAPYEEFEKIYNDLVKTKLVNADETLKLRVDNIETVQKQQKEEVLREFFLEHQAANHLEDFITFEDLGLNITKSASEKALKEQIKAFCEKVAGDIRAIQTDEDKEEILLEYKNNGFDYAKAKTTVAEKKKALEQFKMQMAKNGEEIKQDEVVIQNIETMVSAPVEIVEEEKFEFEFKVKMTKTQAKELKEWLKLREIEILQ